MRAIPFPFEIDAPVLECGELRYRKFLLNEEADLLDVIGSEMRSQRLPHRVGAGLRNRGEDELMLEGDDHRPLKIGLRFSRKAATPSR